MNRNAKIEIPFLPSFLELVIVIDASRVLRVVLRVARIVSSSLVMDARFLHTWQCFILPFLSSFSLLLFVLECARAIRVGR